MCIIFRLSVDVGFDRTAYSTENILAGTESLCRAMVSYRGRVGNMFTLHSIPDLRAIGLRGR